MNQPPLRAPAASPSGSVLLFLLLVAGVQIAGYQFGQGNQVEQFSILFRLIDPAFAPGDFYVDSAAGFGPRYYYCLALAALTKLAPLPAVVFVLTFLTDLALAAVTYDAARRRLSAGRLGAAVAALAVVANSGFALGLAGYLRFDSYQPASLAIPLALFGVSSLIGGRRFPAAVAFAAASLAHPLIGLEAAMVAYAACALAELTRAKGAGELLRAWLAYVPSGLLFGAVIFAAWVWPSLGQPHIPDRELFDILIAFRSPHHYLALGFPLRHVATAILFAAGLGWMVVAKARADGLGFAGTALALVAGLIVVLCLASVPLVDVLHNRAYGTAQIFRMLMLVKWVGLLFFAWVCTRWFEAFGPMAWALALTPLLATGDAQPVGLCASLAAAVMLNRLRPARPGRIALVVGLFALVGFVDVFGGAKAEIIPVTVGAACLWLALGAETHLIARRSAAVVLVAAIVLFGIWNRDRGLPTPGLRPAYDWADIKTPDADIARWAGGHSPSGAVWIVPPELETFRLLARRAVVVDHTSIPFQELAMREWRNRMRAVYGDVRGGGFPALEAMEAGYRSRDPSATRAAGRTYGAEFAVLYADTPWPGPELYRNAAFKAVSLNER